MMIEASKILFMRDRVETRSRQQMTANSVDEGVSWPGALSVPDWSGEHLIPSRVVVKTVFGCNARCPMCLIDHPTERSKNVMPMDRFEALVSAFEPYVDDIRMFDLFGLGEPLLDRYLPERISLLKRKGFNGIGVSTNAHLLTAEWRKSLFEAGVDTILISIDGASKEAHEAARPRTNFERIVANVEAALRERTAGNYKTRFVIRFVQQNHNAEEWGAYRAFWKARICAERDDMVLRYHVHDWSGQVDGEVEPNKQDDPLASIPCHHLFEKMVILANGKVALCFEDLLEGKFGFGNVFENDPIELFNARALNKLRQLHLAGKRGNHKMCGKCSVLETEAGRVRG